jgi:hypothetical protein
MTLVAGPEPLAPSVDGPVYRSMIAIDIEKSTTRTDPVKRILRDRMYVLLSEAFRQAGVQAHHLDRLTDRGDGVLALVRPADEIPKALLVDRFVSTLHVLLADHNLRAAHAPALRLKLRLVVHAGDVHDDGKGFFGEELDVGFRLLDAVPVKRALAGSPGCLAVILSEEIFCAVVRHGYGTVDSGAYSRRIRVEVAGRHRYGRFAVL